MKSFQFRRSLLPRWQGNLVAFGCAVLLCTVLLGMLALVSTHSSLTHERVDVREVQFALPPPPPPPPPVQQAKADAPSLHLSLSGEGPALTASNITLQGALEIEEISPPEPQTMTPDWDTLLQPDWNTLGLEQLDAPPRLLTKLQIDYPNALSRRGIHTVAVELDIVIDEHGDVILRQVLGSPPQEIISPLKELIQHAKFTAPKKDGHAVRAAFVWPLEFSQ